MKLLNEDEFVRVTQRILSDFGSGSAQSGRYIFDQIVRLPSGSREERVPSAKLLMELANEPEVLVLFDPHPNNRCFVEELARKLGCEQVDYGVSVQGKELKSFIAATECDFYITTPEGRLVAVGSHEDEMKDGERIMWRPIEDRLNR